MLTIDRKTQSVSLLDTPTLANVSITERQIQLDRGDVAKATFNFRTSKEPCHGKAKTNTIS